MKSVGGLANQTGVNTGYKTLSTIQDDRLALRLTVLNALAIRNGSDNHVQYWPKWPVKYVIHCDWFCVYLGSTIQIIFFLCEVVWVFVVVFISSVIHITFVFSICRLLLVKIITDTVWLKVALQLAYILITDVNSSYYVILQLETRYWINGEPQITTVT